MPTMQFFKQRFFVFLLVALLSAIALATAVRAAGPAPVQTFYVPFPENEIIIADRVNIASGSEVVNGIDTVIGITATEDNTVLYWDHHEDGFETIINDPAAASTLVLGDGNGANGNAQAYCGPSCAGDQINEGNVLIFENSVPENSTATLFDGGDKIGSSALVAVTRAGWPYPDAKTLLAGAVEVFSTADWGTEFISPVGENGSAAFEDTRLLVTAATDGTMVDIDLNGDSIIDATTILNEGENLTLDGILVGSKITASEPVEAGLITNDIGARFEQRWYNLEPVADWEDSYLSPVGTVQSDDPTSFMLFNPDNTSSLTVNITTRDGTVSRSVPAGGLTKYTLPLPVAGDSGARFVSPDGRPFFAIAMVDDEGSTHDWGYTLLPEDTLSAQVKLGWAPGCDPTSTACNDSSDNYSPLWVTAASPTTLQIDYNGDGSADASQAIAAYQSVRLYDTSDGDQSGMGVFTNDGTPLAAVWGQDPQTAPPAQPSLDMGTTVFSVPDISLAKQGDLKDDVNGNGLVEPGDSILYTLTVLNSGLTTATNLVIEDAPDPDLNYVLNSTFRDGSTVADNANPVTPFPLDEGGITVPSLAAGTTTVITYVFTVDLNWPETKNSADNQASVTLGSKTITVDESVPVAIPVLTLDKRSSKGGNSDPGDIGSTAPGDTIVYTLRPRVPGTTLVTNAQVTDPISANTTYVTDSDSPEVDDHPADSSPLTWSLGSNKPGADGTDPGGAFCPALLTLNPDGDTYIDEKSDKQDENYGDENKNKTLPIATEHKHTLIRYDLSSIPADAVIAAATMQLQGNQNRVGDTVDVHRMVTSWSEFGSTWDNSDAEANPPVRWAGGGDFSSADYNGAKTYATLPVQKDFVSTFDAKELVQDWQSLGNTGMILLASVGVGGDGEWFSREQGDPEQPLLEIIYLKRTQNGCDGGGSGTEFIAKRDTFINEKSDKQDENKGDDNEIKVMDDTSKAEETLGLLAFDVSFIPADATVTSVSLKVEFNSDADAVIGFHELTTAAWTENGATWNTRDGATAWASGDFSASDYGAPLFTFTNDAKQVETFSDANLIALVQDWVDGDKANNGLAIKSTGANDAEAKIFAREKTDKQQPTLIVEWTLAPKGATKVSMSAEGALVSDGDVITVNLMVESEEADTNVRPTTPITITTVNGANAVGCTPDPQTPVNLAANTPHTFTYTCTANAGATPGSVTFAANILSDNAAAGNSVYRAATSNSVLIAPPLTFSVVVKDPLDDPAATAITNTATAASDGTAPVTATAIDALPANQADLSITKVDNPDPVRPGAPLTYTLTITNLGPDTAENVVVVETLPISVTFDSAAPASVPGSSPPRWELGSLAKDEVRQIEVYVTVIDNTSGVMINTVTVSSTTDDPDLTNNRDDEPTTIDDSGGGAGDDGDVGDLIWEDKNGDGVYQPDGPDGTPGNSDDEPGIGNVTVDLCLAGTLICETRTTDGDGIYLFTDVGRGTDFEVRVTDANGVLSGMGLIHSAPGTTDVSGENQMLPYPVRLSAAQTFIDSADFGFTNAGYTITKTLTSGNPVRTGELVVFTIRILNTGSLDLTTIPLEDSYDKDYLTFVGADPEPDDNADDGLITWSDLTAPDPHGIGFDLANGEFVDIAVEFVAKLDTTLLLPDSETDNRATGRDVSAGGVTIPDEADTAGISIFNPTATLVVDRNVSMENDVVTLTWHTLDESNMASFQLYRIDANSERVLISDQPIVAQHSGQPLGAIYSYEDASAPDSGSIHYALELTMLDGNVSLLDMGAVSNGHAIFLPVVSR